jgi:hypothetical protein
MGRELCVCAKMVAKHEILPPFLTLLLSKL